MPTPLPATVDGTSAVPLLPMVEIYRGLDANGKTAGVAFVDANGFGDYLNDSRS